MTVRGGVEAADLAEERALFVDLVGTEISAIWRNVTRIGGQCVAALYLWQEPRSMDDLAAELGRSKSNVFSNLRALEGLGIVRRIRRPGSARDYFELAGEYPDVLVVAFARHLGHTLRDKSADLSAMTERLGKRRGADAQALSKRVDRIGRTYAAMGELVEGLVPVAGHKGSLVSILRHITPALLKRVARALSP